MIEIFWDQELKTPIIVNDKDTTTLSKINTKYMAKDLRPVFIEEKYLLSQIIPEISEDVLFKSVWFSSSNSYFIDGVKLTESIYKRFIDCDLFELSRKVNSFKPTQEMYDKEKEIIRTFIKSNIERYNYLLNSTDLDSENYPVGAYPFIRETVKNNKNRVEAVSFSGGKDSTAISSLVRNALSTDQVIHINTDTTIEFGTTIEYIDRLKKDNPEIPFMIERKADDSNVSDFFELSKKIGPPSRVKTWCCSIFKTGPMGDSFAQMDENWLMFYGIRRSESSSRSKYKRISRSPKLEMQIVASPIIDWLDIDVWLYILTENIDFNLAYRRGFSRVGCWCCPNNSLWSDILTSIYDNEKYMKWHNFLVDFAKSIGKSDPLVYVATGKWKARQGGYGIDEDITKYAIVEHKKIDSRNQEFILEKVIKIKELAEYFKPFGNIEFNIGVVKDRAFLVLSKELEEIMKVTIQSDKTLLISILNRDLGKIFHITNIQHSIWSYVEDQLRKYQICIYCQACKSACPVGAIQISNDSYVIDSNICINCLKCIKHFTKGCLIASALVIKKENK